MTTLLAAIDNSAATRPVLETALRVGRLLGADVEALHVLEDGDRIAVEASVAFGIPLCVVHPPVTKAVLDALRRRDVIGVVIGVRGTPTGPRPAGHAALALIERAHKPVVIVPPEARARVGRPIRRVLVPFDGTSATADAVHDTVKRLAEGGSEVLALHVFGAETTPRLLDRPEHDLALWGHEFLARNCDEPGVQLHWRTGSPAECVVQAAAEADVDLVVLTWSRHLTKGRAAVVREALARSRVPVMLVPVIEKTARPRLPAGASRGG